MQYGDILRKRLKGQWDAVREQFLEQIKGTVGCSTGRGESSEHI